MEQLPAVEITIINSAMLPQIVILSIIFLGEKLNFVDFLGIIIIIIGVILGIQLVEGKRT